MTRRTAGHAALLATLCLFTLLPAAAFRGLAGMEFRTALFVREILRDGPSLIPRLDGAPYYDYPPLYFLSAALSSRLFGAISPLSLALPSILAAAGTTILVFFMTERERPGLGLAAGAALAVTPLFLACAPRGNVDAMLLFFITLSLAGCRRHLLSGGKGALVAACAGLAGGVFTKGAIAAVIPLCATSVWLALRRRFRLLADLLLKLGVFLVALAALSAAAVLVIEGRDALAELLDAQLIDRVRDEANQPRLYYLGVFLGGLAPWSLLSLGRPFRREAAEGVELDSLCASWLLSTLVILSFASIKHSRYLLPAAPPVAVLAVSFGAALLRGGGPAWVSAAAQWLRRICLCLLAAGAAAGACGPLFLPAASPLLWAGIPVACLIPFLVPSLRRWSGTPGAFALFIWTMAAGFIAFTQFDAPRTTARDEARPFVREIDRAAGGRRIVFYEVGEDTDALKFLYWSEGNAPLEFTDSLPGLADALDGGPSALLVVRERGREAVEGEFGPHLRLLFGGLMGKRRCAVYQVDAASARPGDGARGDR